MTQQKVSYQLMMRVVGAYLDEHGARRVNAIEMPEGFLVRFWTDASPPVLASATFRYHDIDSLKDTHEWRRPPNSRGKRRDVTLDDDLHYQDLFRALGFELDEIPASSILLDEADEQLLLTYMQLDPAQGFVPRKHMILLSSDDRGTILAEAYKRRTGKLPKSAPLSHPNTSVNGASRSRPRPRDKEMFAGAPWEVGEREIYRTDVRAVSVDGKNRGYSDVAVSDRRIVMRFQDGRIFAVALGTDATCTVDIGRSLLTKYFRLEVVGTGTSQLALDCYDREHLDELAGAVGQAVEARL